MKALGRDEAGVGTWAGRRAAAVDRFDEALDGREWSRTSELRVLEGGLCEWGGERIQWARRNRADAREGISGWLMGESGDGFWWYHSRGQL